MAEDTRIAEARRRHERDHGLLIDDCTNLQRLSPRQIRNICVDAEMDCGLLLDALAEREREIARLKAALENVLDSECDVEGSPTAIHVALRWAGAGAVVAAARAALSGDRSMSERGAKE